jgi:hypothetical protein
MTVVVIPVEAGIHSHNASGRVASFASLDSRLRGNDGVFGV